MAILQIANLGEPVLRQKAKPVAEKEIGTASFQAFIDDLLESLNFHDGVGLAAPQVFRSQRVVAVEVPPELDEFGVGVALSIFINPEVTIVGEQAEEDWEGCLSLKDLRGLVLRPQAIKLRALDRSGNQVEMEIKGFPARVVQHEVDHLDGIVFLDRMKDLFLLSFARELERRNPAENDRRSTDEG
jgi:peptide deformylase